MTDTIAAALPMALVRVSNTNLYRLAADHLGDATLWTYIAEANGLIDPWVVPLTEIRIPDPQGLVSTGGVLGL